MNSHEPERHPNGHRGVDHWIFPWMGSLECAIMGREAKVRKDRVVRASGERRYTDAFGIKEAGDFTDRLNKLGLIVPQQDDEMIVSVKEFTGKRRWS